MRIARVVGDRTGAQETEKWEKITCGFEWVGIGGRMREEEAHWGKYGSGNGLDEIEVWNGCLAIGIEFN